VCEHWRRLGEDWRHFSASEQQETPLRYMSLRGGVLISSAPTPPWLQVSAPKALVRLAMLGINGVRDESAR
jgi:hypothetical protein